MGASSSQPSQRVERGEGRATEVVGVGDSKGGDECMCQLRQFAHMSGVAWPSSLPNLFA